MHASVAAQHGVKVAFWLNRNPLARCDNDDKARVLNLVAVEQLGGSWSRSIAYPRPTDSGC